MDPSNPDSPPTAATPTAQTNPRAFADALAQATTQTARKKARATDPAAKRAARSTQRAGLATKRRTRRRETRLAFEALAIEGGLLSPEWLARVAALEAGGQSEADYGVPKGLQLRDEIGRFWRIAQAYWADFAPGLAGSRADTSGVAGDRSLLPTRRGAAESAESTGGARAAQPLLPAGAAAAPDSLAPDANARARAEHFVLGLLREVFGFASLVPTAPVTLGDRTFPIGHAALSGTVPVVVAPAGSGLDTLVPAFGDGGRRRSAFGLAQEYLNAAPAATWGLASDGTTLRILRDNASLTRPAWIEADLARIFTEERYADFAALWLLAHASRFGRGLAAVASRPAGAGTASAESADAGDSDETTNVADSQDTADTVDTDDSDAGSDAGSDADSGADSGADSDTRPPASASSTRSTPTPASTDCALERWREAGREEGTRAREHLRAGVEEALASLGQGFLAHPANSALRAALAAGSLTPTGYFQELLRLVYRLIFLLTVEERGLLHPAGTPDEVRQRYAGGYALGRLRDRATRRSAHDRFDDLWEGVKIVLRALATGEKHLGLPALAGLFATHQCPHLDAARLENRALLLAMFRLGWLREAAGLARVNWRDMGPEELGSVYESLLELVPQIAGDGRSFRFATGGETKGNARKTTGSYYTPDSLVQVLLDSALEPVVAATIASSIGLGPERAVDALLGLTVVDPACGSGHFLLAAARRLAGHVARLRAGGTPSAAEYRHALREVVGRCLYGVDLNPMAVELCKVSLWMEAVEPGLPLGFLDAHVQHGNALLGATPELMAQGIPDAAWEPIEGDDRKVASALKKRNKAAAGGQRTLATLWGDVAGAEADAVARAVAALDAAPDADLGALAKKEAGWAELLASDAYRHQKLVADAWCAAFVWPKQPGPLAEAAPTTDLWLQIRDRQGTPPALTVRTAADLAADYALFHWHLQFPQVFARGGFDVVLGNPPWERVKLQEQEFFAPRSAAIAEAPNAAARKKLIAALAAEDPQLWHEWIAASRRAEGESHLIRNSGRFPLCGKGDVNTYAVFAEHNRAVLGPRGRAGFIVPTGIATDDTTKEYFRDLVANQQLKSFLSFENEEKVFPGVHNQFKFALVCLDGTRGSVAADLLFFARHVGHLRESERQFSLRAQDFDTLNPNTGTCPTFRSRRDADLNLAIYRRVGVLWREQLPGPEGNPWGLRFMAMLHMANDSGLFRAAGELRTAASGFGQGSFGSAPSGYLPLIEAKLVHHFDHRYATYENATQANLNKGTLPKLTDQEHGSPSKFGLPEYWVPANEVAARLADRWNRSWLLGWRDISRSVDERTVIASLIPRAAVGHTTPLMLPAAEPPLVACLYANLCSFALDYTARQKVGGTHLTYNFLKQLPVLTPTTYTADTPWQRGAAVRDWLLPRVLELTYTAWDLEPFAEDVGYDGPPFRWDPARRFLLRAELDAAFFHLYGLSKDDTAWILDTFPIVRKHDVKAHGEYRTKRVILELYDAMAGATRTGVPYATRLDPPPADPRVAHPPDPTRTPAAAGDPHGAAS
jgi:hypothetical protein